MVRVAADSAKYGAERRTLPRNPVAIPARLELPSGARWVQIADLNDRGARLHVASPPAVGASALLKWQSHECFSTVVWVQDSECGLRFEQDVPRAALSSCASTTLPRLKPVAALDKIRVGAKRRQALVLDEERDTESGLSWTLVLRRPTPRGIASLEVLSAAEQMFFYGAPLAHVVRYQEDQSARRGASSSYRQPL
jgi:hypothetical protein